MIITIGTEIIASYEARLKESNPRTRQLTYSYQDLQDYVDGLSDISALVYDGRIKGYIPHDREWIKSKLFQHLKRSSN